MKKNKKPKTISRMTNTRGVLPPPTVKDEDKRKKSDRHKVKRRLKSGDYDV